MGGRFFPAHQISETSGGLADGFPGKHAATPSEGRTTTSAIQGHRRLPQCIDGAVEHRERRALKKRRSEPARVEVDFFFCGGKVNPFWWLVVSMIRVFFCCFGERFRSELKNSRLIS